MPVTLQSATDAALQGAAKISGMRAPGGSAPTLEQVQVSLARSIVSELAYIASGAAIDSDAEVALQGAEQLAAVRQQGGETPSLQQIQLEIAKAIVIELAAVATTVASAAPKSATYVVASANATLTAERVATSTASVTVDIATASQMQWKRAALTGDVTASADSNALTIAAGVVTEAMQVLADNTTQDVTSTKHGYAPKAPADATKFLDGSATPAWDTIKDSDLSTSDITTNDVSTSKHGFVPKAPNSAFKWLDGTGAWTTVLGRLVAVQDVVLSGTVGVGANTNSILAILLGGGGGGGGCSTTASQAACGGGGGSGGICIVHATVTPSTTYTYTCGSAGAAGANTGGTGGTGGTTTLIIGATTYTANGGLGGEGQTAGTSDRAVNGGAGAGVSTNGTWNGAGAPGSNGYRHNGNIAMSGDGGNTILGGAGVGLTAAGAGNAAVAACGGGGSGGCVINGSAAVVGGAGGTGRILVLEFA